MCSCVQAAEREQMEEEAETGTDQLRMTDEQPAMLLFSPYLIQL